jgi:peptidoglycan hydrolase-like protein with peptidoglycan-binding domain
MTHALDQVSAAYSSGEHPHQPAGSPTGGQFAPTDGGSKNSGGKKSAPPRKAPAKKSSAHHAARRTIPAGQLGFDGERGTGYGHAGGDLVTKGLQGELKRLHITDSHGRALKLDGKFGPLTTEAVKDAQRRLGMNPSGVIAPAFIARLKSLKTLPAKKAAPKKAVKAAADEPYGDVEYADPGYQADGKKRYPLDSEEHCRAAWSYINQAGNADMYTDEQLVNVRERIRAAGRRYGIDFGDSVQAATGPDLRDVELARPGSWNLSSGPVEFTEAMLRDAADFYTATGGQAVPVKLGHVDDRFDGEPTFGSVTNVRYLEDDRGPVLLGDIVGMPGWLAAAAPTRWPNRSIEGWRNFDYDGRQYALVLSGLALLGVTPPGVKNIRSLADLQLALAASSAEFLVASAPADEPAAAPAEPAEEPLEQAPPPQTPAPEAEDPNQKGAGMDPAKIREALGLPAEASDDEVKSTAATALGFASEPASNPDPVHTAPVAASGTVVLATSVWEETQKTIKSLTDHVEKTKRAERDEVIASAVVAGKFTPAQKPHFSRLWDADPDGTRTLIDTLTPNSALAVMASGYADGDTEADTAYSALFGKVG